MRKDLSFAYPGFLNPPLTRLLAVPSAFGLPRRRFLISSAASGLACAVGCTSKQEAAPATAPRSDVPLRVLLCGSDLWAEAISTAWGGIAQQPLSMEVIAPAGDGRSGPPGAKDQPQDLGRRVAAAMTSSDVAIVPCGLMPTLHAEGAFTPLSEAFMKEANLAGDSVFPVLRESAMRWAGNDVAVPLGSVQPALLIAGETDADTLEVPKSWDEYIELAGKFQAAAQAGEGGPVVGEPLAGGAAAKMFLWRASDAAPRVWLFDRESLEPVLRDEVYVQTLETMRACAKLYGDRRWTAGELWNAMAGGRLKMAIGWPGSSGNPPRVDSLGDTLIAPLPRSSRENGDQPSTSGSRLPGVLADADAPIALLSSRCRQTASAKRFLAWLCGGEGSEMIRDAVPSMTLLRNTAAASAQATSASLLSGGSSYEEYLRSRLSSLQLRPTLRLHRYDRYLAALDQQVLACLDGKSSAAEALAATSDAWREITAAVGQKAQAQAWRQAQGLRH